MKLIKPFTLGLLQRPYALQRESRFAVAALGFFRLGEDAERFLPDAEQWPLVLPLLPPGLALDEIMPKAQGEVLLLGSAHAPGAAPLCCMCVRLAVGTLDKRLRVVGPRSWRQGWRGRRLGPAQPFTSMPLSWEHAYGGPGHRDNPCGMGYRTVLGARAGSMPNLEYAGQPVSGHGAAPTPACYAPLAPGRAQRQGKLGSYGQRWREQEAPGLASDLAPDAFNCAPPDQRIEGFFQGGEAYRLEGMHPDCPLIEGTLPDFAVRAFVLAAGAAPAQARELALAFDTVWFLPGLKLGIAVYHGQLDCADSDGLDIGAVMVGYEQRAAAKSASHYQQVLGWRSDATQAARHLFDEAQLAPALGAATLEAHALADQGARTQHMASKQALLDELDAEFWQARGTPPPSGHVVQQARVPLLDAPSARALAARDFSTAGLVGQAERIGAKSRRYAAWLRAETHGAVPLAPLPDAAAQFAAALERAIVPAYDLLPHEETGRDPELAGQLARLEQDAPPELSNAELR
ncbi:MAG: DUF2169 domain-containing protein, partial [Pseudomonadota bacterium]